MSDEPVRLSKLMAERGHCSRREADEYISKGLVLVDGQRMNVLGSKVLRSQTIILAPAASRQQETLATILLKGAAWWMTGSVGGGLNLRW